MGNSYLQTSGRAMEEHFAWEIPIYKLNLLLGGAFRVGNFYLQTQLAFRVGNFYLQTQLVCFPYLQTIYKPIYKPHS